MPTLSSSLMQPELAEYQPEIYLDVLTQLCRELSPRAILLSNDTYSQEIAPRLAHRLGGSAVGDGVGLQVQGDNLRVTAPSVWRQGAGNY